MERGESAFPILERLPAHPFASQTFHALPHQAFCQSLAPPVPLAEPLATGRTTGRTTTGTTGRSFLSTVLFNFTPSRPRHS